jgi:hypothetical protein
MTEQRIRAVVFKEGDWWILQGLDYDFAVAARTLEDMPVRAQRFLAVLFDASRQHGVEPFYGYSPAPRRFWKMYEAAEPWTEPLCTVELPEDLGSTPVVETRLAA